MKALIYISLRSFRLFSTFLQHFLLVRMIGAASHSNLFSYMMQLDENTYITNRYIVNGLNPGVSVVRML